MLTMFLIGDFDMRSSTITNAIFGLVFAALLAFTMNTADAKMQCNGRIVIRTGPSGVPLKLCLDGKYSTCMRDGQRLGWSLQSTQRTCDRKRAQGYVR